MNKKIKDLTGQRFGRLLVKRFIGLVNGQARFSCVCDCENWTRVHGKNLVSGRTKSCGCLRREMGEQRWKKA